MFSWPAGFSEVCEMPRYSYSVHAETLKARVDSGAAAGAAGAVWAKAIEEERPRSGRGGDQARIRILASLGEVEEVLQVTL
jgi:hypothetical protein